MPDNILNEYFAPISKSRGFIEGSRGNGNQVATLNVIHFVRDNGFAGEIELIYPSDMQNKVIKLFGLPASMPANYVSQQLKIHFIPSEDYIDALLANKVEHVPFAFNGANCNLAAFAGLSNLPRVDERHRDITAFANADYILCYSSYYFSDKSYGISGEDNQIFFANPPEVITQLGSHKKFIRATYPTLDEVRSYLSDTPQGQQLVEKNNALPSFIDGMENETYNVMNWYGYPLAFEYNHNPSNIFQALLGARHAQLSNQKTFNKPLVIAVYYNYTSEINYLNEAILNDRWTIKKDYRYPEEIDQAGLAIVKKLIREMDLKDNFFTGHLNEKDVMQRITALKDGQIFLLSMGPLPLSVMNALYAYLTKFPAIREGASSLNLLVQTGLAHLRCGGTFELACKSADFTALYNKFCTYNTNNFKKWADDYDVVPMLGKFILDSQNPDSSTARCFREIQKEAQDPEDRISVGFKRAIQLSAQRKGNYSPQFFAASNQENNLPNSMTLPYSNNANQDLNLLNPITALGSFVCMGLLALGLFKKRFSRKEIKPQVAKTLRV